MFVKGKKAALIALLTAMPLFQAKASVEHDYQIPSEQTERVVSNDETEQKESDAFWGSWLFWWLVGIGTGYGFSQIGKSKNDQSQR